MTRLLATFDVRIFLAEFHAREIQKTFTLTINYIARATVLLNTEEKKGRILDIGIFPCNLHKINRL